MIGKRGRNQRWIAVGLALGVVAVVGACGGSSESSSSGKPDAGDSGTVCTGVDCSALDDECSVGVCNPLDGKCAALAASDGAACKAGHCAGGVCTGLDCKSTTADCDSNADNGCEVNLTTDPSHCGSCLVSCSSPSHATATCDNGTCGIACNAGFGDCDGISSTGCEANLSDVANCGSCGNVCQSIPNATPKCTSKACDFDCLPGFGDCNTTSADGCETNLSSNPLQCGDCTKACAAGNACNQSKCSPVHRWSKRFGGSLGDAGHAIAFDSSGNVYVVGKFMGAVSFGGSTFSASGFDAFVASYDGTTGAHRWSRQIGGSSNDEGMSVTVDSSGNVYVSGFFGGTADFGGGAVTSSGQDAFIASYTGATGSYRWSKPLGGIGSDAAAGIAVDPAGNVYVTGYFSQTVNFGGTPLTSAGGTDIFVASYQGANGAHRWSKAFGDPGSSGDGGTSVAADVAGHVYVAGYYFGSADYGGGALSSNGGADVFLASFDSGTGAHVWSKHFGGTVNDRPASVAADGSGNVYVAGLFQNTTDFGAGSVSSGGSYDSFLASYDVTGAYRWSRTSGAVATDEARGVAVDSAGNVFLTGYFGQSADFGTGTLTSAGGTDLFVASYTAATGAPRWSHRLGGTAADDANGIAVDNAGGISVTGSFEGQVDFGGGNLTSQGLQDAYVLVLTE